MKTSRSFAASQQSVGAARRFVSENITDLTTELQDAVILMVSELATNALIHAASGFQLTIDRTKTRLRVSVADLGPGVPSLQSPPSRQPHGRGLQIVEQMSDQWGTSEAPKAGKTVWFQLNLASTSETGRQKAGQQPGGPEGQGSRRRVGARSDNSDSRPGTQSDSSSRAQDDTGRHPGASHRRRARAGSGRPGGPAHLQPVATGPA
jgi:anti-sigma regulatory factor (Ser/Thr protein kinase)